MLYHLEFVRYVGDKAEEFALKPITLVGNTVTDLIAQADELLVTLAPVSRPDAYRLRGANGTVVYVSGTPKCQRLQTSQSDRAREAAEFLEPVEQAAGAEHDQMRPSRSRRAFLRCASMLGL